MGTDQRERENKEETKNLGTFTCYSLLGMAALLCLPLFFSSAESHVSDVCNFPRISFSKFKQQF